MSFHSIVYFAPMMVLENPLPILYELNVDPITMYAALLPESNADAAGGAVPGTIKPPAPMFA